MRATKRAALILTLALGATLSASGAMAVETPSHEREAPWFNGSVEQAFAQAKTEHKPLFLYWGAVWCPPCNELKAQVFHQPRFKELMAPLVAVYLDGDEEAAQTWGAKLKISGYPTVLVLSPEGKELMRLNESMNFAEFESALTNALQSGRSIVDAIQRARDGKATDQDWKLLATYGWASGTEGLPLDDAQLLEARHDLAVKAPAKLAKEKAVLAAGFLEAAAGALEDDKTKALAEGWRKDAPALLDAVLATPETVKAARIHLVYSADGMIGYVAPQKDAARAKAEERMIAALDELHADPSVSIDNRLWAAGAKVSLFRLDAGKDAPVPAALKAEMQKAVAEADAAAKTPYDRHSAISGAADLLYQVGDVEGGQKLLEKEIKATDTPWYYQSTYSYLENKAGHKESALKWAQAARESVKGRASRIQWIVEDLALTAKTPAQGQEERLVAVVKDYYDTALAQPDGFEGRNAKRAAKVSKELKPWLAKKPELRKLVSDYAGKCQKAKSGGCSEHFAGLLTGA